MGPRLDVLVVDDDYDLAETTEDILTGWGHRVTVAHDGESAVALFRERSFDLCFMDVRLPGANGVECFLEIRQLRPEAQVVIMTGYSLDELLARALAAGAVAVLHKPLSAQDILQVVEKAAARGVVLVVDDDGDFAASVQDALWGAGYSALVAHDGAAALAKLADRQVDVMVLDLRLPIKSGLEVCQELARAGRAVPTIVVTGFAMEERAAVARLGDEVSEVMRKPVELDALVRAVEGARGRGVARR